MVDKLGTELSDSSQRILSERRPEKTCRKKTVVGKKLGRKSGWDPWLMLWKAHPTKATRLEGYCPLLLSMYSKKARKIRIIIQKQPKNN